MKSFFRQYYVPNNAVLVLSGDFDEKQAQTWVRNILARSKPVPRSTVRMPRSRNFRHCPQTIRGPVCNACRASISSGKAFASIRRTKPALDILSKHPESGRGSRLQSRPGLWTEPLAQQVFAGGQHERDRRSLSDRRDRTAREIADDIEKAINSEIERIKKDGPTADEIGRAVNGASHKRSFRFETDLGTGEPTCRLCRHT